MKRLLCYATIMFANLGFGIPLEEGKFHGVTSNGSPCAFSIENLQIEREDVSPLSPDYGAFVVTAEVETTLQARKGVIFVESLNSRSFKGYPYFAQGSQSLGWSDREETVGLRYERNGDRLHLVQLEYSREGRVWDLGEIPNRVCIPQS